MRVATASWWRRLAGETCMQTLGLGFTWEQLSPG